MQNVSNIESNSTDIIRATRILNADFISKKNTSASFRIN
jgi:hypothetical protein